MILSRHVPMSRCCITTRKIDYRTIGVCVRIASPERGLWELNDLCRTSHSLVGANIGTAV
jgi:hypothetical protein